MNPTGDWRVSMLYIVTALALVSGCGGRKLSAPVAPDAASASDGPVRPDVGANGNVSAVPDAPNQPDVPVPVDSRPVPDSPVLLPLDGSGTDAGYQAQPSDCTNPGRCWEIDLYYRNAVDGANQCPAARPDECSTKIPATLFCRPGIGCIEWGHLTDDLKRQRDLWQANGCDICLLDCSSWTCSTPRVSPATAHMGVCVAYSSQPQPAQCVDQ